MKQAANIIIVVNSFTTSPIQNQRSARDADTAAEYLNTYLAKRALGIMYAPPPSTAETAAGPSIAKNNNSARKIVITVSATRILYAAALFLILSVWFRNQHTPVIFRYPDYSRLIGTYGWLNRAIIV